MQPGQLEQLKRLIGDSPLLQDGERAHWLELLPLMNDKQLLELEAILRPASQPQPQTRPQPMPLARPAPSPSQQAPPLMAPRFQPFAVAPPVARPSAQMPLRPSLSHLTNLPTIVTDMGPRQQSEVSPHVAPPQAAPQQIAPARVSSTPRVPESRSPIELRSKMPVDITEKELPSGHMADSEHLLTGRNQILNTRHQNEAKEQETRPSPLASLSAPPPVPRPVPSRPPSAPTLRPVAANIAGPNVIHLSGKPAALASPASQASIQHSTKRLNVEADKKNKARPAKEPTNQALPPEPFKEPLDINSLADLTRMGIETFHAVGPLALTAKLQTLVKQVGYFDIIFALEQSPLYADYVATGQNLLEENATFDGHTAVRTRHGATLLSRPDFEAMADLLRQIQIN